LALVPPGAVVWRGLAVVSGAGVRVCTQLCAAAWQPVCACRGGTHPIYPPVLAAASAPRRPPAPSAQAKLGRKNRMGDQLTGSGHKASKPTEDEPAKLMALLPWVLPAVCVSILVLVAIGAKMCQKGNYKHTEALREGGVKPSFKYGGPIGAGPM